VRGDFVSRSEVRQVDPYAEVNDTTTKDFDSAALVDLPRQPLREPALGHIGTTVQSEQPLPFLRLRRPDESEQLSRVQPQGRPVVARRSRHPAMPKQVRLDGLLEPKFSV